MIRPVSCLCLLLAAGSGMYLYQAKHQGHVLDSTIADLQARTAEAVARSGVLRGEYALLNDPSRLQELVTAHLPLLVPLQPGQFTRLADLDQRLPAVAPPPAPEPVVADLPASSAVDFPGAAAAPAAAAEGPGQKLASAMAQDGVPPPATPAAGKPESPVAAVAPLPRPRPRMAIAAARPAPTYRAQPMTIAASGPMFAARASQPFEPAMAPAQPPSLLGMARDLTGQSRAFDRGYGK